MASSFSIEHPRSPTVERETGMSRLSDEGRDPKDAKDTRSCPTCQRCRDCGYTHIGVSCPDPDSKFDGTCLCDPILNGSAPSSVDSRG